MLRSRGLLLHVHNAVLVGKVDRRQNCLVDAIDEASLLDLNNLKVFLLQLMPFQVIII